ncbi:MAG: hypothetical protein ABSA83_09870 [Verrucomicrobiota bacterium]|jgi:hypothetical protein
MPKMPKSVHLNPTPMARLGLLRLLGVFSELPPVRHSFNDGESLWPFPLNSLPVKKVDMKSNVPYFMPRNEYLEPATAAERAASVPRGGRGLIIRFQEFSNPIADKTGAGVFAFTNT